MKFNYTAERDGQTYESTVEAKDRFEVYSHVRSEGGSLISVKKDGQFEFSAAWFNRMNVKFSTVKEHDKIIFARNLAAMVKAGLSMSRALAVSSRQAKNPKLNWIINQIASDIRAGKTLHLSLKRFSKTFPNIFIAMARAGEEAGNLPEALRSVSDQMEETYKLKKKIKGAMMYPSVVLFAMVIIGVLMLVKVVPTLAKTFTDMGAKLPATTRAIIGASDFLMNNALLALGGTLGVVILFIVWVKTKQGQRTLDYVFLRMPTVGTIVKEVNSARMARTLSSLLSSGVEVVDAISITEDIVQNSYHKEVLVKAKKGIAKGQPISSFFMERDDLYPPLVGEMMAVGEETGQLPQMLAEVANFYESEVAQKTKNMSTIIEPFLMLFIGAGVGFFALSMIAPIYSLSEVI